MCKIAGENSSVSLEGLADKKIHLIPIYCTLIVIEPFSLVFKLSQCPVLTSYNVPSVTARLALQLLILLLASK